MKLVHVCTFERNCSIQHCKQNNTTRPYIWSLSIIPFVHEHFWSNVGRSTTLISQNFLFLNYSRYSKITKLELSLMIEQYVVKLYISMNNAFLMHIYESLNKLLEEVFCIVLRELSSLSYIVKQISSWANLHHNQKMLCRLISFI